MNEVRLSGRVHEVLEHDTGHRITSEWLHTSKYFIEHNTQGVDIGLSTDGAILYLFGRDVEGSSKCGGAEGLRCGAQDFSQAKVRKNGFAHRVACCIGLVE